MYATNAGNNCLNFPFKKTITDYDLTLPFYAFLKCYWVHLIKSKQVFD